MLFGVLWLTALLNRPPVVARSPGLSAGVDGVGGGDDLVVGWELRGLDSLLGSLDERIMARYS